jgi:hypothetical protein
VVSKLLLLFVIRVGEASVKKLRFQAMKDVNQRLRTEHTPTAQECEESCTNGVCFMLHVNYNELCLLWYKLLKLADYNLCNC